jgi:hypothetical protein
MIQSQVVAGAALALLAAFQLRWVFRTQEAAGPQRFWLFRSLFKRRSARIWSRPRLGDRPMFWKELFTSRSRGLARLVSILVALLGGGFLLYYALWFGILAFFEMRDQGYAMGRNAWLLSPERTKFYFFLKAVVPLLYVVGILSVAGAAAASITSEHEDDTWTSLTATDLTAVEIVQAKLYGALWRPRLFVVTILLLTLGGIIVGSLHPLSLAALCISLAVYGWFAAALGVCISLQLRSTWRAQFLTTSVLLLINLIGQAILSNVNRWAPLMWPGFTPYEISKTLLSSHFLREWAYEFSSARGQFPVMDYGPLWSTVIATWSLLAYLGASIGLTLLAYHHFDRVAGRARRPLLNRPEPDTAKPVGLLEPSISE